MILELGGEVLPSNFCKAVLLENFLYFVGRRHGSQRVNNVCKKEKIIIAQLLIESFVFLFSPKKSNMRKIHKLFIKTTPIYFVPPPNSVSFSPF